MPSILSSVIPGRAESANPESRKARFSSAIWFRIAAGAASGMTAAGGLQQPATGPGNDHRRHHSVPHGLDAIARQGAGRSAGRPAIAWVVRAARAAIGVDDVWVATSTVAADDLIARWCADNGVPVMRLAAGLLFSHSSVRWRHRARTWSSASPAIVLCSIPRCWRRPCGCAAQQRRLRLERRSADLAGRPRLRGHDGGGLACRGARGKTPNRSRARDAVHSQQSRALFGRDLDRATAGACQRAMDARHHRRPSVPTGGCHATCPRIGSVAPRGTGCARPSAAVARDQLYEPERRVFAPCCAPWSWLASRWTRRGPSSAPSNCWSEPNG